MNNETACPQGRIERIVRRLLGDAHVARLQNLNVLKQTAEYQARVAMLCGLARLSDGSSACEYVLGKHDDIALSFNAARYWWMKPIKLRQQKYAGMCYRPPAKPPNAEIKPPRETRSA